ncbi:response regulator transcription factor [Salinisphaera orenii]|uniref:Phosphate regulon transcriptional regulatory protein PhoB n=1 Tax=Salinisphaera orenii YIM 95161 TaxID=1051139 RepID=A0A423PL99_9GAMM|nr:response regulator transcription factor [Salinisphaera halophila]ROO26394.1 PhoB family transcriptional regulator [Salinisphaera halophila YIM 95161]
MAERILCVEDDPDIGRLLVAILGEAGYPADWVTSGERALECWRDAALVVLDLMLPGIDGLAVCREIRGHDAGIPLIMLTALAGTRDVVLGLEIGADDYITKPFDAAILLARVQALLRRRQRESTSSAAGATSAPIVVGALRVDIDKHEVRIDEVPVSLTAKEFALLALFARNPGHGFSRSDLLDQVWGPEFDGFDHTVNTHINRLRGKIEADPAAPRYIQTVWGVGYRFVDPLDTPDDA